MGSSSKNSDVDIEFDICPTKGDVWQVDGFGCIGLDPNQASEHFIEIIMKNRSNDGSIARREIVKAPISIIKHAKIHSFWRNGARLSNKSETKSLRILRLEDQVAPQIRRKSNMEDKSGESTRFTLFFQLNAEIDGETKNVLIPCVEVLSFFFGQYSKILQLGLSGRKANEVLYDPGKTWLSNGTAKLKLREGVRLSRYANAVAFIVFQDSIKNSFNKLHPNIFATKTKRAQPIRVTWPLESDFPCVVETIKIKNYLIITHIKSTSLALPYQKLELDQIRPGPRKGRQFTDYRKGVKPGRQKYDPNNPPVFGGSESPSSDLESSIYHGEEFQSPIPNVKISYSKENTEVESVERPRFKKNDEDVDRLTTASGDGYPNKRTGHVRFETIEHAFDIHQCMNELKNNKKKLNIKYHFMNDIRHPSDSRYTVLPDSMIDKSVKLVFQTNSDLLRYKQHLNQILKRPVAIFIIERYSKKFCYVSIKDTKGFKTRPEIGLLFEAYTSQFIDGVIIENLKLYSKHSRSYKRYAKYKYGKSYFCYFFEYKLNDEPKDKADYIFLKLKDHLW
ncbi:hypothetical protein [Pleionea mediterranea]|uniref:Uncharacterized protein n=1 Tax=Pleionea mediterranea TaxID=523701 RepID=A0A316FWY9_9GAMM|nr:hypothetical protein [Pleionea mediterranea]PWK52842.1 hypothetical protein C8D97_10460 [Pleionea mediterranea]